MILLEHINKDLRDKLTILLKDCIRYDITIDKILDDEYKECKNIKIYVDSITSPDIIEIIQGTFIIFAGNPYNDIAIKLIKEIPPRYGIQPSCEEWVKLVKKIHKNNLKCNTRYKFCSSALNENHLKDIIHNNKYREYLKRMDLNTVNKMYNDELQKYHFLNFNCAEDFMNNSFGFCIEKDNKILSACTACILSKNSAEISIITHADYRRKGLAALTASKFILYCLHNNLIPHYDAANYSSYLLALKLGFKFINEYKIYYLT